MSCPFAAYRATRPSLCKNFCFTVHCHYPSFQRQFRCPEIAIFGFYDDRTHNPKGEGDNQTSHNTKGSAGCERLAERCYLILHPKSI
jgi:hypothetical protein